MQGPFFFHHIPKTAGTTLNHVFNDNLGPEAIYSVYTAEQQAALGEITYNKIARYRLVRGHMFIRDFSELVDGPLPFRVFTFLRDPVRRVVSEYRYLKTWPKNHLYGYLNRNEISLAEYVTSQAPELRRRGSDCMVNSLSGTAVADVEEGLEAAWHNVKDRFVFFGILEQFDESLLMLKRVMGLERTFYERHNVLSQGQHSVSDADIEVVIEHNQADIRLYRRAVREFDARVADLGAGFQSELRMFRKVNERLQRVARLVEQKVGLEQGAIINAK